jgi:long-chain fatty acid transport protein
MADLQYVGWGSIQQLAIYRNSNSTAPLSTLDWHFKDTWRGSVGVNYNYSDQWVFRGGVAYDETPTNTTGRTPGLPDDNRWWLAFGVHYNFSKNWDFDLAYAHEFLDGPDINQNGGSTASYGLIKGSYDSSVNIIGAQMKYKFN